MSTDGFSWFTIIFGNIAYWNYKEVSALISSTLCGNIINIEKQNHVEMAYIFVVFRE